MRRHNHKFEKEESKRRKALIRMTLIPVGATRIDTEFNRITICLEVETDSAWFGWGIPDGFNPPFRDPGQFPKYAWKVEEPDVL